MTPPAAAVQPARDATDERTWSVAYHESGHCVTAIALGKRFTSVTIRPDHNRDGHVAGLTGARYPLAYIAILIGGSVAQALGGGQDVGRTLRTTGKTDLANIERLGDGLHPAAIQAISRRVLHILTQTHSDAVMAVAEALVSAPTQQLTYQQVADIVEDWQPGGLQWQLSRESAGLSSPTHATAARRCTHAIDRRPDR